MTRAEHDRSFLFEGVRILEIHAASSPSKEEHIDWNATFSDPAGDDREEFDDVQGDHRVLITTLHAGGDEGWATAVVGAALAPTIDTSSMTRDEVGEAIKQSSALESMYDLAHLTIRTMVAAMDVNLELPRQAPEADIEFYDHREHAEDEEDSSAEGFDLTASPED